MSIEGSVLYCTTQPLHAMHQDAHQRGHNRNRLCGRVSDDLARELLEESGIIVRRFEA